MQKKLPIDYTIVFILGCLFTISLIAIYSGSGQYASGDPTYFIKRQLVFIVLGLIVMMVVAFFDFELLERWTWLFYLGGIFLLVLVEIIGVERNGSKRWIDVSVTEIQPSEFMKIFLVLHIAMILSKIGKYRLDFKPSLWALTKILFFTIIPLYLIWRQPDLGTTLMILFSVAALLLISSLSLKLLGILVATGITGIGTMIYLFLYQRDILESFVESHQMARIYGWLDPEGYSRGFGYQLQQALLGIGSGQLSGSGFKKGYQVQSGHIPEAHTDFIFAVIGEEFGFIGTSLVVVLFFLLIYRIITIALQANSLFGMYICVGVIALLTFQIFQNIGMTIGLMPITGLALPFVSYGGSALLTNMLAIGLVTSVHLRTKSYMFGNDEEE